MLTFKLPIAHTFPHRVHHLLPQTEFIQRIRAGSKLHEITPKFSLWQERLHKIDRGEARLVLFEWRGPDNHSQPRALMVLNHTDNIGIQPLSFDDHHLSQPRLTNGNSIDLTVLAHNNGLTPSEFYRWYKYHRIEQEHAIVHFTPFRYL